MQNVGLKAIGSRRSYPLGGYMLGRPSDEEALRLVVAFYCIVEPEKRSAVRALAEKLALDSASVEGITHYKLLESGHADH